MSALAHPITDPPALSGRYPLSYSEQNCKPEVLK
jgi:hypothetical protein